MENELMKKAYYDMVALYDSKCDGLTYNLLGDDTEQSIFDDVKSWREFRGIKNELSIRNCHARNCQKSLSSTHDTQIPIRRGYQGKIENGQLNHQTTPLRAPRSVLTMGAVCTSTRLRSSNSI